MKRMVQSFLIAFSMYSKIPMPPCRWTEENMAYTMCFFPWVGAVIGALTWGFGLLASGWGLDHAFYTILLLLIPWLVTGGIHLDGLLDTADAMSSWQERERRLEILKDSHAGAFAVITCVVYYLFYFGVYSQMPLSALPVVAVSFMLSRTLSGLAVVTFPKAKKTGTVAAMARGSRDDKIKMTLSVYLILLLAVLLALDWKLGLICFVTAWLVFWHYHHLAMKYFGGTTGDLAGYFVSLCELFCAFAVTVGSLIF